MSRRVFSFPSRDLISSGALGTKSAPTAALREPGRGRVTRERAMALAMAARTGASMLVPMMPSPSFPLSLGLVSEPLPFVVAVDEEGLKEGAEGLGTKEGAVADMLEPDPEVVVLGAEGSEREALGTEAEELVRVGWSAARRLGGVEPRIISLSVYWWRRLAIAR